MMKQKQIVRPRHRKYKIRKYKRYVKVGKEAKISPTKRKLFAYLSNPDRRQETGGILDFDKKGLEAATVNWGKEDEIDITLTPDAEAEWHTHVTESPLNVVPSYADLEGFVFEKPKSSFVFYKNNVFVMTKTPRFKQMLRKLGKAGMKKELLSRSKEFDRYATSVAQQLLVEEDYFHTFIGKFRDLFEDLGIKVSFVKASDAEIKVPLSIIEPKGGVSRKYGTTGRASTVLDMTPEEYKRFLKRMDYEELKKGVKLAKNGQLPLTVFGEHPRPVRGKWHDYNRGAE